MKRIITYWLAVAALVLTTYGCSDKYFDANPGDRVTQDQLKNVTDLSPFVNGMYAYMIKYNSLRYTTNPAPQHNDFGYMSIALASDLWGQDMVQYSSAYGWFYSDYKYTNRGYETTDCLLRWSYLYKLIKTANDVLAIGSIDKDENKFAKGQALAMRAFGYLNLVELYQFTYKGNESKLAVPIVTEKTSAADAGNNPRATVQKVYDQITSDLESAVTLLEGFSRTDITSIDKQVAAGFLARTYLNMENWAKAAQYAGIAKSGYSYMSNMTEGFVNMNNNPSWMWASDVNAQSDIAVSGIVNFTSHISSTAYGYSLAGAMYKCIDANLYSLIPSNDVRKQWWLGANTKTVTVLGTKTLPKYANLKFGYYDLDGNNFNDLCYMRAEEMALIEAEAAGFVNLADGKSKLEAFVKTRQPDFTSKATTPQELQQEVWLQRRIELWGEGFSFNDLKRLKKGTLRNYAGTNHKSDALVNLPVTSDFFNLRIPRSEIQNNTGIPESANNPNPVLP